MLTACLMSCRGKLFLILSLVELPARHLSPACFQRLAAQALAALAAQEQFWRQAVCDLRLPRAAGLVVAPVLAAVAVARFMETVAQPSAAAETPMGAAAETLLVAAMRRAAGAALDAGALVH